MSLFFAPPSIGASLADYPTLLQASNSPSENWPTAIIASSAVVAGAALIAVIVWQVFLTARSSIETKANAEAREELRALTQRAVASGESSATELARVSQHVTELRVRMGDIEKILKDVE